MRDFTKVSPSVWHSEHFNSLGSDDAKLAYLYLLTSPHQSSAGCCRLPDAYAAADLHWPVERYQSARSELEKAGLINFDPTASVIMVTRWFRVNPPQNPKHLDGIRRVLGRLPSQSIWAEATAELDEALATAANPPADANAKCNTVRAGNPWARFRPRAV